jgi:uncharacterized protein YjbJ (UPF0337 family)
MVNAEMLQGNWNEIKGKLRQKWGQLTSDDLQAAKGNIEQLVGLIQRKTGEARSSIESYLEELTGEGASSISHMADTAREYAHQAMEKMQHRYGQAAESFRHGYEEAEHLVKDRPMESLSVCFGVGVLAGVLLGLVMSSR